MALLLDVWLSHVLLSDEGLDRTRKEIYNPEMYTCFAYTGVQIEHHYTEI